MAARNKQVQQLARQLARLSVVNGEVSSQQVAGVLEYLEKHRPPHTLQVLRAYRQYIAAELARSQAVVEHAGPMNAEVLRSIESAMAQRYGRPIHATARPNDSLIAGIRVRVADDVYESSIAGQLTALAQAV